MLKAEQRLSFENNGYLIIKNFLSEEACNSLRTRMESLASSFKTIEKMSVFTTGADRQTKDRYFLESGDKIRFFLEDNSETPFFNKCGHALHTLDPVFAAFSNSEKIRLVYKGLGLKDPFIMQSMYIFKQPRVGGEVAWHQDATFLYTEPNTVIGLWFALDDASEENGCLWAIPGGHKGPLRSRFRRLQEAEVGFTHFDSSPFQVDKAVPLEASKGSLVVLHSFLPHMSKPNLSLTPRHAFTLHAYERTSLYPKDNWLRF